jgi:exopolyphosphatase/guanosine-5'-triphosphate,3'-diphosphate pyrophosphatase
MSRPSEARAVIDLGTQSAVLLGGRLSASGGLEVLVQDARLPRLGEGLAATGGLGVVPLERAALALSELRVLAEAAGCPLAEVVGTAVFRRAENGEQAASELARRLGVPLRVISGEEEARLAHAGACGGSPSGLVIDTGGGSTELVTAGGAWACSAPVGASWLAEHARLGGWDLEAQRTEARARIQQALAAVPPLPAHGTTTLVGGTAVNAGSLAQAGGTAFRVEAAEGARVEADQLLQWARELAELGDFERGARFPIEAERAGTLPSGLVCLAEALGAIGVREAVVSTRGLRHAALMQALSGELG